MLHDIRPGSAAHNGGRRLHAALLRSSVRHRGGQGRRQRATTVSQGRHGTGQGVVSDAAGPMMLGPGYAHLLFW